jgi:hypothetical protein
MRKWIHRALKGASLTTALFVFQACYGTPPGPYEEFEAAPATELVEADATDAEAIEMAEDAPVAQEAAE